MLKQFFHSLSSRRRVRARSERKRAGSRSQHHTRLPGHEQLEARKLMAIDIFAQSANGGITAGWVTIIANNGDDVYVQRAATKDGALLVANNASFLNRNSIPSIDTYADVFVTNASRIDIVDQEADQYPLLPYPLVPGVVSNKTSFVLEWTASDIDNDEDPVNGILSNGVGGRWQFNAPPGRGGTWEFSNPLDPNFVQLQDLLPNGAPSVGPVPVRARIIGESPDDFDSSAIEVEWNSSQIGGGNFSAESPPILESITFDRDSTAGYAPETYSNILATTASSPGFTLPGGGRAFGEIVAGTLSGVLHVDLGDGKNVRLQFTTETQQARPDAVNGDIPLVFRRLDASNRPVGNFSLTGSFTTPIRNLPRTLRGFLDPETGFIQLRVERGTGQAATGEREVGPITIESATFARFETPTLASDFTLFPGQNFIPSLTVDLLAPGSTISIESPVVASPFVDLRGTNVIVDARVSSKTHLSVGESLFGIPVDLANGPTVTFSIVDAGNVETAGGEVLRFSSLPSALSEELTAGTQILLTPTDGEEPGTQVVRRVASVRAVGSDTFVTLNAPLDASATEGEMYVVLDEAGVSRVARTVAERAFFNAAVAAKAYDIRLADEIQTAAAKRSTLFVSATGSLAGELPTAGSVSETPFDTLFALVNTGDILIEGTVNGAQHSYIMQSPQEGLGGVNHRGPYYFSTDSLVSGGNTGLLKGGTVAITLGNDVPSFYDDVENGGSSAFNVVVLQTEITNLRVQASDRRGSALSTPFPYDMDIREKDDVFIDAVAASSLPIVIGAGEDIDFRASLATASDVEISAGGSIDLNAPLSSAFGSIVMTGKSLTIANSVRVLDGFSDDLRTDIRLTATAGSLQLTGPVSAVNTVELSQTDPANGAGGGRISGPARVIADTLSFRSTGSVSVGTDVRLIKGRAERDVSITEANTVYADITALGNVALTANGADVEMLSADFGAHLDRNDSVAVTAVRVSETEFTLPANFAGLPSLFVGMGLQSSGVIVGTGQTAASIAAISAADQFGVVTVTVANGTIAVADGEEFDVQLGIFAEFTAGALLIPAPVGADIAQLSVGQQVISDLLPVGTRIVAIDDVSGQLTLSAAATADGVAGIRFVEVVALWGTVRDAASLYVSAPRGSIDIYSPTSATVVLGNKTDLAAGTALPMRAAGTVTIRSLGGAIDVLDAPVGGLAATAVRVVATASIGGAPVYDPRTPGTFPGTLTNNVNGGLVIDGITLRQRDHVLLAGQTNSAHNGVYQVVEPGSATTRWVLARLPAFDTTAEMAVNSRFRPSQGASAGRVFAVTRYDNLRGTTPISVETVPNQFGAFPVTAASTLTLADVGYDLAAGTIESLTPAALSLTAFDGVRLEKDDYVLVRLGVVDASIPNGRPNMAANGVYRVDDVGGGGSTWKLTRVGSDLFDVSLGGVVAVDNGTLRSRVTGNGYRVAYDSLGVAGMTVADVTNVITTEIGSDNFNAAVTYVVSTNGGTNAAAGSLGKMLLLAQQNIAVDPVDSTAPQKTNFRFGNTVSDIVLTQQLPEITRAITLDGSVQRYSVGRGSAGAIGIDGSRITQLRDGRTPAATDQIHGLDVRGQAASNTRISSLTMYGFGRGAAVRLLADGQALDGVVIDSMRLGTDLLNRRSPNAVGIQTGGNVGRFTTISRNQIFSSTAAGIRILNGSPGDGVRVVGNTIGRPGFENAIGIEISAGADRQNRIGLESPGFAVPRVTAARVSATQIRLPNTFSGWANLYVGMGVSSAAITGIASTSASATIKAFDQVSGLVEIEGGEFVANRPTPVVDFGIFARFTVGERSISIPQGLISIDALYLGQPVSAATTLPQNTVITAIDRVNGFITLSNVASRTTSAAIVFTAAGRNAIASNIRGIVHANGATRVVATDVFNSVFDGITVNGGTPRIGAEGAIASAGRSTAKDTTVNSNTIYGNGGAGIFVAAGVPQANVTIRGNILGADGTSRSLQANRRGNILFAGLAAAAQPATTATFTRSGTTVTVTVSNGHGLPTGYRVFIAGSTPVSGVVPAGAYTITRVSNTQFTFVAGSNFTASSGSLRFEKYGPLASLSLTGNRDFEGNQHGLGAQTSAPGSGGGGVTPPQGGGRPVAPPPRRR